MSVITRHILNFWISSSYCVTRFDFLEDCWLLLLGDFFEQILLLKQTAASILPEGSSDFSGPTTTLKNSTDFSIVVQERIVILCSREAAVFNSTLF